MTLTTPAPGAHLDRQVFQAWMDSLESPESPENAVCMERFPRFQSLPMVAVGFVPMDPEGLQDLQDNPVRQDREDFVVLMGDPAIQENQVRLVRLDASGIQDVQELEDNRAYQAVRARLEAKVFLDLRDFLASQDLKESLDILARLGIVVYQVHRVSQAILGLQVRLIY